MVPEWKVIAPLSSTIAYEMLKELRPSSPCRAWYMFAFHDHVQTSARTYLLIVYVVKSYGLESMHIYQLSVSLKLEFTREQDANGTITLWNLWGKESAIPMINITDKDKSLASILLASSLDIYNGAILTTANGYYTAAQMRDAWTRITG